MGRSHHFLVGFDRDRSVEAEKRVIFTLFSQVEFLDRVKSFCVADSLHLASQIDRATSL